MRWARAAVSVLSPLPTPAPLVCAEWGAWHDRHARLVIYFQCHHWAGFCFPTLAQLTKGRHLWAPWAPPPPLTAWAWPPCPAPTPARARSGSRTASHPSRPRRTHWAAQMRRMKKVCGYLFKLSPQCWRCFPDAPFLRERLLSLSQCEQQVHRGMRLRDWCGYYTIHGVKAWVITYPLIPTGKKKRKGTVSGRDLG